MGFLFTCHSKSLSANTSTHPRLSARSNERNVASQWVGARSNDAISRVVVILRWLREWKLGCCVGLFWACTQSRKARNAFSVRGHVTCSAARSCLTQGLLFFQDVNTWKRSMDPPFSDNNTAKSVKESHMRTTFRYKAFRCSRQAQRKVTKVKSELESLSLTL